LINLLHTNYYLRQHGGGYEIVHSITHSFILPVSTITEKVISQFHWNLGVIIGPTDWNN